MIRVAILGSTGYIGRSTLEVIRRHPGRYEVVALAGYQNVELLAEQVEQFGPRTAVVADGSPELPASGGTEWVAGRSALLDVAARDDVDVVLNALVGSAGLEPTLAALDAGHRLALANKESLVAGGPLVLRAAAASGAEIVPIDSEHSAILQCLEGHDAASVQRLILTASGGPFRGKKPS
ncbi:MAG: 1-deoxy-D-xylulose-5-phosphate reductoisomerase, partial [Deltaproteobacteria bacterium]|nr:1-deoxy-D-xylulose-5-phosphate reductoisomerase [Deltaproteobacteria bacterium]